MESNAANTTSRSAAKKRNYVSNLVFASVFVALAVLLKISFEIEVPFSLNLKNLSMPAFFADRRRRITVILIPGALEMTVYRPKNILPAYLTMMRAN